MKNPIVIPVVVAIVAVVGGFIIGVKYQEFEFAKSMQNRFPGMRNVGGEMGTNTNRLANGRDQQMGFRGTNGEVIKRDATSMTVKMGDGSSKLVLISDSTKVTTSAETDIKDVMVGSKVVVVGSTNPDGSITAQNIQLNPFLGMMGQPQDAATNPATRK